MTQETSVNATNFAHIELTPDAITQLPRALAPFVRVPPPERPEKASHFLFRGFPRAGIRSELDHTGHRFWKVTIWVSPEQMIACPPIEWDQTHKEAMSRARDVLTDIYTPEELGTPDRPFLKPLAYHY